MQTEIVVAGFGGQGVLFAGQLLAYTGLEEDLHVTWIPSYGPEMRGGTAHCTVIVSDAQIGSPMVKNPFAALTMNLPSFIKYETLVKAGGVLVINSSLIDRKPERADINVVLVPATEIADELGNRRMANLAMLGALMSKLEVLSLQSLVKALDGHIPDRHRHTLEANLKAMQRGYDLAGAAVNA